jgi:hypothetical protein
VIAVRFLDATLGGLRWDEECPCFGGILVLCSNACECLMG